MIYCPVLYLVLDSKNVHSDSYISVLETLVTSAVALLKLNDLKHDSGHLMRPQTRNGTYAFWNI